MSSYWHSVPTPASSKIPLSEGKAVLARLENGDAQVIATVLISGIDDDGNAVGSVIDYIPKNAPFIEDVFYVYLDKLHPEDTASTKNKQLVVRHVDRQGVPWSIQAFHTPKVITGEDVLASSPSYFDADGRPIKFLGFTLDDVVAAIDANTVFRDKPSLTENERDKDFPSFKDSMGVEWLVYSLTDPSQGPVGFYAAPNVFGMPVIVGPSKSLVDLSKDVKTYVGRSSAGFAESGPTFSLSADAAEDVVPTKDVEPPAEVAPTAQQSSSNLWLWALLGVGAIGLLSGGRRR